MFVIERPIEHRPAREYGFDRVELRRRNLIRSTPYRNAFGVTYDSGDYAGTFEAVLEARRLGWLRHRARRSRRRAA